MMKRAVLGFLAAVAISAPAVIAPALVTPAAAQVDLNLNIGVPAPFVEVAPVVQPVYYGWGHEHYREWEHREWERNHWRAEHRDYEHHYR
jgi:hypothetical protein